jgi:hypothetical protein
VQRIGQAVELYEQGADFVYLPRIHSARELAHVIEEGLRNDFTALREEHLEELRTRDEVLA